MGQSPFKKRVIVVLTWDSQFLAILKGGGVGGGSAKGFHSFKGGGGARKVLPCLKGVAQNVSDPRFFHFAVPSLYLMTGPFYSLT